MSSRIAACGQPPVSTARMRLGGQRLVADQELGVLAGEDVVGDDAEAVASSRSARQSASSSAVLPLPTGPPMPTVNGARADSRARSGAARSCEARRGAPRLVRVIVGRGRGMQCIVDTVDCRRQD